MPRLAAVLIALALALTPIGSAFAQDDDDDDGESAFQPVIDWAVDTGNRAGVGLNNVITAPADPFMFAAEGDEVFEDFWAPQVLGRGLGFVAGAIQMPYRAVMGGFDMLFSWVPYMYMQSPVPRFKLIPATHDDE